MTTKGEIFSEIDGLRCKL